MEINTPATIGPGEFFPVVGVGPHEKPWPTGAQSDAIVILFKISIYGDSVSSLNYYSLI